MTELIDYKKLGEKLKNKNGRPNNDGAETLDARITKHDEDILRHNRDLEKINQLMFFGFIVLLVMVAGLVVAYFFDLKNSYNQLQDDRYHDLKNRIELIELRREGGIIKTNETQEATQ
jgi:hypothetical protein